MRVVRMVRQVCRSCRDVVHAKRFETVTAVVEGIVRAGRLTPAAIGRGLWGSTAPKHGIKRVDRLLVNPRLYGEQRMFFRAIAATILRGCSRPIVVVDWTQVLGTHRALVAAVPIGGRALPIYAEVHPERLLGNSPVQARFLQALRGVLPDGCKPIVVSDAGFHGPFFRDLLVLGWDFLGRIRGTATVLRQGRHISKEQIYATSTSTPRDLGQCELYSQARQMSARLVLVRKRQKPGRYIPPPSSRDEREFRKSARDPWLLATSLDLDASAVVAMYATRMQIEEAFRDAKNHRFGWSLGHVRTASPHRAQLLLLLAALAMVVVTLVGLSVEARGAHRAYQANTVTRRVLSLFVLGNAVLRRQAALDLPLSSFTPYSIWGDP
jgi:hypothetical protein